MRTKCLLVPLLLAILGVPPTVNAQLSTVERQGLLDALDIGNMRIDDLDFERKPFSHPGRMPIIDEALDRPLETADRLIRMHASSRGKPLSQLLKTACEDGLADKWPVPEFIAFDRVADAPGIPVAIRKPVVNLLNAVLEANAGIRVAITSLSANEKRIVIDSLPALSVEEPKVQFDFVRNKPAALAQVVALLNKVQLWRIRVESLKLASAIERVLPDLQDAASAVKIERPIRAWLGGIPIVVAGTGSDTHDETGAMLTIDLGGNDRYVGRHGAGVGYASVLVDLSGDDDYDVLGASVGVGILGIGIAVDEGGRDRFHGASLNFGAAMAGVGALRKVGGDDTYSAMSMACGFAAFGVGLCIDTNGDDVYRLGLMGQGASRTNAVGWMIDEAGSDTYRAGGVSLNSPLFKDVYYSFAQGYSSGYREDTGGTPGGLGMLTDLGGDDFYCGETYCQAASYWFAVGSQYDARGNDTYSAYHYAQSSAMHMCASFLFDLAGDDSYTTKFGASHAIGHDYGVAFMLDRVGSDIYAARDSSPGTGNANGLGLFIDVAGEDRYDGPPATGNPARGAASLGVFVDLAGPDRYRTGMSNGGAASRPTWATAYDAEDPPTATTNPQTNTKRPQPGSQTMPSEPEMERMYQKATQWAVGTAQEEVAASIDHLIAIGMPAFEWMLDKHLKNASRLEQRAFVSVASGIGPDARNRVAFLITNNDDDVARVALQVCVDGPFPEAGPALAQALKRPGLLRMAVRAAGELEVKSVAAELLPFCAHEDRLIARGAVVSLARLAQPVSLSTAEALVRSKDLLIRKAAITLMAKLQRDSWAIVMRMVESPDEREARIGCEILTEMGSPEALRELGKRLLDPRPGLRIQALLGLNGRCPPEFRDGMLALIKDPDGKVRAVASRVQPQ